MPKVIVNSGYIKDVTHFINYLDYSGKKLEAQALVMNDGTAVEIDPDKIIDVHDDSLMKKVSRIRVTFKDGVTIDLSKEAYAKHTQTEQDSVTESVLVGTDGETIRPLDPLDYLQYIGYRPGAEKDKAQGHGLFGLTGTVDMKQAKETVIECADHIKWSHIVSLTREDAQRTGFDNRSAWETLLRAKAYGIAKAYNISPENLVIYGAYHDKSHHPHMHLYFFSKDKREGFVKGGAEGLEKASGKLRSLFTNEIFRDDVSRLKEVKQTRERELEQQLRGITNQTGHKRYFPDYNICKQFEALAGNLQGYTGRPFYGYLLPEQKEQVNETLKTIVKNDKQMNQVFLQYLDVQKEFVRQYNDEPEKIEKRMADFTSRFFSPDKKDSRTLHNLIVQHALRFNRQEGKQGEINSYAEDPENHVVRKNKYDIDSSPLPEGIDPAQSMEEDPDTTNQPDSSIEDITAFSPAFFSDSEEPEPYIETEADAAFLSDWLTESLEPEDVNGYQFDSYSVDFTEEYKKARNYLYGNKAEQNFETAFSLFQQEAQTGNALAMADLGHMYEKGLYVDKDDEKAQGHYKQALQGLLQVESEKHSAYLQYRIGKMYLRGQGTEQDYTTAADWFAKSAAQNNKFAQYSLGNLYYHGNGVPQDYEKAFSLYRLSADQENAFAHYELGKMYGKGIGTEINLEKSEEHFTSAFCEFVEIEKKNGDDTLTNRIGQMYLTGTGTPVDYDQAVYYFKKAASVGNQFAQCTLGKLYLEGEKIPQDIPKGLELLTPAAEQGNQLAQYTLGKLYLEGEKIPQDIPKGIELLTASVEQGNQFAQNTLGKLYLAGEKVPQDIPKGLELLTLAAEQGNQFAQYTLGKLYLAGEKVLQNIPEAVKYLTLSAGQGNQFAQYTLGKLYLVGEKVLQNVPEAVKYLTLSAGQGNQFAQYTLGKLYFDGKKIPKNIPEALSLLKAAAWQGNQFAQYTLGKLYLEDESIIQNTVEAVKLLTVSAKQGNQYAQYTLGKLYLTGEKVQENIPLAVKHLTASAEQGNQYAQYTLGRLYLDGEKVPQDIQKGQELLKASAAQGNQFAQEKLEKTSARQSTKQNVTYATNALLYSLCRALAQQTVQSSAFSNYSKSLRKHKKQLRKKQHTHKPQKQHRHSPAPDIEY